MRKLIPIGKDGGIREPIHQVDLPRLFAAIDQMPMRPSEMASRGRVMSSGSA